MLEIVTRVGVLTLRQIDVKEREHNPLIVEQVGRTTRVQIDVKAQVIVDIALMFVMMAGHLQEQHVAKQK
jgi:hypothetical protein